MATAELALKQTLADLGTAPGWGDDSVFALIWNSAA